MLLSQHAVDRMRQRSIPFGVVEMIGAYAEPLHSSGSVKFCIDSQTLDLIQDDLGCQAAQALERFRSVFLVEIGGTLVTVARRTPPTSRSNASRPLTQEIRFFREAVQVHHKSGSQAEEPRAV